MMFTHDMTDDETAAGVELEAGDGRSGNQASGEDGG